MYKAIRRIRRVASTVRDRIAGGAGVAVSVPGDKMSVKTVEDFGYTFNSEGSLRKADGSGGATDQPFQFSISDNHQECQRHYEELGDAVTHHVYGLLEREGLARLSVPVGSDEATGSFVFASKDYEKRSTLLVLIHGSGVVRAGQWARSLIINDNIETGSQIPYIRQGLKNDYGILIMNTNDNYRYKDGKPKKIPHSGDPTEHAYYVWEKFILPAKATTIAIVAHSYGGINTVELARKFSADFEKRVKAVAFTDSVHGVNVPKHLVQVGRNWVASNEPVQQPLSTEDNDVARVSAGHIKHEMTSHSAMESVFRYFAEKIG